jgi:hypothetical protein
MPSTSTGEVGSASAPVEASAATSSAVKTTTTTAATMPSALSKRRIRGNSYYHDCKE